MTLSFIQQPVSAPRTPQHKKTSSERAPMSLESKVKTNADSVLSSRLQAAMTSSDLSGSISRSWLDTFSAPSTPTKSQNAKALALVPCKFFKSGKCTAGDQCCFSHAMDIPQETMICKFFLRGNCKFGTRCALSHQLTYGTTSGAESPLSAPNSLPKQSQSHRTLQFRLSSSDESDTSTALPPALPLPSPESIKHPQVPLPIRHKSMPDIFRWSADDGKPYPSSNFLFYSSSFGDRGHFLGVVDEELPQEQSFRNELDEESIPLRSLKLDDELEERDSCMREVAQLLRQRSSTESGCVTPDPFSPFPCDYSEEEPAFVMEDDHERKIKDVSPSLDNLSTNTLDELSAATRNNILRSTQICPFAIAGNCKFGDRCRYVHGKVCPSCEHNVLHPYRPEENEEHLNECKRIRNIAKKQWELSSSIRCNICKDQVVDNGKFGLLECEHPFCLSCIRAYRSCKIAAGASLNMIYKCPSCSRQTPVVAPSLDWIPDQHLRSLVINDYKLKIRTIPCKFYLSGDCPFGENCFYSHEQLSDDEYQKMRIVNTEQTTKVLNKVKLADFLARDIK